MTLDMRFPLLLDMELNKAFNVQTFCNCNFCNFWGTRIIFGLSGFSRQFTVVFSIGESKSKSLYQTLLKFSNELNVGDFNVDFVNQS